MPAENAVYVRVEEPPLDPESTWGESGAIDPKSRGWVLSAAVGLAVAAALTISAIVAAGIMLLR